MFDINQLLSLSKSGKSPPGSGDLKLETEKLYNARLETIGKQLSQVTVSTGKGAISIPLQHLPRQIIPEKNYQIKLQQISKDQVNITFFDANTSKANAQTAKIHTIAVSPEQLLRLVSKSGQGVQTLPIQFANSHSADKSRLVINNKVTIDIPAIIADTAKRNNVSQITLTTDNKGFLLKLPLDAKSNSEKPHTIPLSAKQAQQLLDSMKTSSPDSLKAKISLQDNNGRAWITLDNKVVSPAPPNLKAATAAITAVTIKDLQLQLTTKEGASQAISSQATPVKSDARPIGEVQLSAKQLGAVVSNIDKTMSHKNTTAVPATISLTAEARKAGIADSSGQLMATLNEKTPDTELLKAAQQLLNQTRSSHQNIKDVLQLVQAQRSQLPANEQQLFSMIEDSLISERDTDIPTIHHTINHLMNYSVTRAPEGSSFGNNIALALQLLLGAKKPRPAEEKPVPLKEAIKTVIKSASSTSKANAKDTAIQPEQFDTKQDSQLLKSLLNINTSIKHQQASNLERLADNQTLINLTLPIKTGDEMKEVQLQIKEEEPGNSTSETVKKNWQLTLTFDLGKLGKMMARAQVSPPDVSIKIYAEQQNGLSRSKEFVDMLSERLTGHGINVADIQCSLGKITRNTNSVQSNAFNIKV